MALPTLKCREKSRRERERGITFVRQKRSLARTTIARRAPSAKARQRVAAVLESCTPFYLQQKDSARHRALGANGILLSYETSIKNYRIRTKF